MFGVSALPELKVQFFELIAAVATTAIVTE